MKDILTQYPDEYSKDFCHLAQEILGREYICSKETCPSPKRCLEDLRDELLSDKVMAELVRVCMEIEAKHGKTKENKERP